MSSDLFDLWETGPAAGRAAGPEMVSFSAPGTASSPESPPVWRVDLPADPQAAENAIAENEARVAQANRSLESIPQRVETIVQQGRVGGGVSFSTPGVPLPAPERQALELLGLVEAGPQAEVVSYGLPGLPTASIEEAARSFQTGLSKLERMLSHLAWVETQRQGVLQGRSVVGWSGGLDTLWTPGIDPETARLHERSLRTAIASRTALVNTFVVTTQGAARLAVMLSTPGGALLALPIAWKLVNQVMAQVSSSRPPHAGPG